MDRQLLHCLHRNAISNACKYGAPHGEVLTKLTLTKLGEEPTTPVRVTGDEPPPRYAS